jgi:hypothetical protein
MFPELDIDLLRTFVAVVESGSFTKASRAVFRSQAAVSMQVKRLEESIGQPLFVRDTRNLELGQTGKALLPYARRLLNLHDETWTALVQPEVLGQIIIGAPDAIARRASNSKKTGVSANKRRRCIDSKPKAPPSRKGIRHPYVANRSCVIPVLRVLAINEPSRIPPVNPPVKIPQAMPTLNGSTCSLTKTHALGTSPPTAIPCKIRKATVRRAPRYPV